MNSKRISEDRIELVGESSFILDVKKISATVCNNNASILLLGEKGTGKKLLAKYIHLLGKNSAEDFYDFDCKSFSNNAEWSDFLKIISENTFLSSKITIFLSFVNQLSVELQNALVLLLKDTRAQHKNIRFIFSSTVMLENLVEQNVFSKDLYYLINSITINMVPLRQRKEDILLLAQYYFEFYKKYYASELKGFSENAKNDMLNCFWAGNVAELKNAVERGFIVCSSDFIKSQDLAITSNDSSDSKKIAESGVLEEELSDKTLKTALDSFKKAYLIKILEENNWNQTKTAKVLGIQRTYVIRLINELEIRK